ncbi:MAG TPA: hypothetical protein GXZ90_05225 [Clostridiales bacterium]|nr:hypothetical protein [Clostridiales bacterium]
MDKDKVEVKLKRAKILLAVSITMLMVGLVLLNLVYVIMPDPVVGALLFVFAPIAALCGLVAFIMLSLGVKGLTESKSLLAEIEEDESMLLKSYRFNLVVYTIILMVMVYLSVISTATSLMAIVVYLFVYIPFKLITQVNKYRELKHEGSSKIPRVVGYIIMGLMVAMMIFNTVKHLTPQTYGMNLYLQENYRDAETDDNLIASKDSKKVYHKDFGTYVAVDLIERFGYNITPDGSDYTIKNNIAGKEISTRLVEKIKVDGSYYFDLYDITNELEPYGVHVGSSNYMGGSEEDTRIETIIKFKKTIPKYRIEVINNAEDSHITYPISDELIYHSNRFEYQEYEPEYYELPDVNIAYAPISVYETIGINVKQTESGFDFSYGDVDTTLEKDSEDVIYYFDDPKFNIEVVCEDLGIKVKVMFNPYVDVLDEYANDDATIIVELD